MTRNDQRQAGELRPLNIIPNFMPNAAGSCLIETGRTRVLCTATVQHSVPPFLQDSGKGWLTAEYSMLPGSTITRKSRERQKSDSRSIEIQRLIGRSLRAAVDMELLGEHTINIDCDVIQGDGGTRTASVTGGFVAMALACKKLLAEGKIEKMPIKNYVAGISAGIVDDVPMLDLQYFEDSSAMVDLNCIMNDKMEIIELQGTGEGRAFTFKEQETLVKLCSKGLKELMEKQKLIVGEL